MKSLSLESIYAKLHRNILLAESYTEIPELSFIIKACRLKPFSYFFENKTNKLTLITWWFDEFGNSLKITKNKRLKVIQGDLSLDRSKIICTDLYQGLSIDKTIKMSKCAYFCYGQDEDIYQDCLLVSLLGIDNYLRTYLYMYGDWKRVSPLLIGIKNLKLIARHTDIQYFHEFTIKENTGLPCQEARVWLTCLPAKTEFLKILEKQCSIAFAILNTQGVI
jgi:hypothetical protein